MKVNCEQRVMLWDYQIELRTEALILTKCGLGAMHCSKKLHVMSYLPGSISELMECTRTLLHEYFLRS